MNLYINNETGSLFIQSLESEKYRMIRAGWTEWIVTNYYHDGNHGSLTEVTDLANTKEPKIINPWTPFSAIVDDNKFILVYHGLADVNVSVIIQLHEPSMFAVLDLITEEYFRFWLYSPTNNIKPNTTVRGVYATAKAH